VKNSSAATQTILSGGEYGLAGLYDFTLSGSGLIYRFTDGQFPLSTTIYLPNGTTDGPHTYNVGLVLERGDITQKVGVEGGSMKLTVVPVAVPVGFTYTADITTITADTTVITADTTMLLTTTPVFIAGYPFLQACRYGLLDDALVRFSKFFYNPPSVGQQLVTSQGAVGYFEGIVEKMEVGRFMAELTINDYLVYMNTQQMPRNVYRAGCGHTFLDKGCDPTGSVRTAQTVTGATVTGATDGAHFTTNLTQADHWWDLGYFTFTSGVNQGFSGSISSFLHSGGAVVLKMALPNVPQVGDVFTAVPGCDLSIARCNVFGNLAHNMSTPFIPVPETMVDGGTFNPPAQNPGAQAGMLIGSGPTGRYPGGKYST
jgi:hypothetical protein